MSETLNHQEQPVLGRERSSLQHYLRRSQRFLLIGLPLAFLVIWTSVPILWAFMASLNEPLDIYDPNTLFPSTPSLRP
mgnify:CR=1 FL=1